MPVNYTLLGNPLTERPDDFRAITTTEIIVDEKFLVEFLAQRGNTSTTLYLAVVNEINETQAPFIATNSPKSLVLLIPALPAGDYKIKVVTQYNGGSTMLKSSRNILFDKILTIP